MTSKTQIIADLARPFTFYTLASSSAFAIITMSRQITNGYEAAAFMGVVLAGASAIYLGKSFENVGISRYNADLEKTRAQVAAPSPPTEALTPAPAAAPALADAAEDPAQFGGPRP